MGEINDKLCKLLSTKEYFADFWNGIVWTGEHRIKPEQLCRDDKEYYKFLKKSSSICRDVLMKLRGRMSAKLGIEIMETIDYTIPVRVMDYDGQEMKRQLNDIAIRNRHLAETGQTGWEHSGEFLYGVRLQDRILPVMTVALYCGWEEYDGAMGILPMCELSGMQVEYKEQFLEYPLRLYSLKDLDEMCFETGLRELVAIFKRSKDRVDMKEYYEEHKERFRLLDTTVIDAMGALIGISKLKLFKQEGRGLDLCKAFEDEREEGFAEGRVEGHEEGLIEGGMRVSKMIEYMFQEGKSDDIKRAVTDMVYQREMLEAYGLL